VEGTPEGHEGAGKRVALTAGVALAVLVAIIAAALLAGGGDDGPSGFADGSVPKRQIGDLDRAAEAAGCTARDPKSEGRTETGEPVEYESDPPHSGDHAPEPAEDAAYRSDPPPDENVVHSLFHGRIAIWFDPDLPEGRIGDLKALFDEAPQHAVLLPRESMEHEVAATAWTHILTCPRFTDATFDAVRAFRDTWRDQGPEFVP
jgi:hypothetical protein